MSSKKHDAEGYVALGKTRVPSDVTAEAVVRFYEALDCSKSLAACLLYKYGEFEQLLDLTCDPLAYETRESFRDAYLAVNYLSKSTFLKTSWDKEDRAIQKFKLFEDRCREVNAQFAFGRDWGKNPIHACLLSKMKRKIAVVLGAFDPEELMDSASWGPGVSTLIKGEETSAAKKFQCETGITQDLYSLAKDLLPLAYPGWDTILKSGKFPTIEKGNKVLTVPKTSKVDRVIAVEPGINLWFQLGVGSMIKRRLGRFGIDLSDQTRNQRLAQLASITGELATVDFSSASDSISSGLVRELFADTFRDQNLSRWLEVLDICRSKCGFMANEKVRWKKFSSMGNGFTFPLQSLIFYAAACSVCEYTQVSTENVSVYGDDVIIPSVCYELFNSFSSFLGFTVNTKKSFSSGPFRESCGSHYFMGTDCKPLYLEDALTSPQRVFNFANTLRLRSHRQGEYPYGCDDRFRRMFYWLQTCVPKKIRFKISASVNASTGLAEPTEGGFLSNFDEACPSKVKFGAEGYRIRRLAWVAVKQEVDYPGLLQARLSSMSVSLGDQDILPPEKRTVSLIHAAALRFKSGESRLRDRADGNELPLRGITRCIYLGRGRVRQWYDLGPWI